MLLLISGQVNTYENSIIETMTEWKPIIDFSKKFCHLGVVLCWMKNNNFELISSNMFAFKITWHRRFTFDLSVEPIHLIHVDRLVIS